MANQILAVNPPDVKTNTIEIIVPGHVFHYTITRITERSWLLTAVESGATKQFVSEQALLNYLRGLRNHLERKYQLVIPDLSLPQLPARVPRTNKEQQRIFKGLRVYGSIIPTRGVIYLPSSMIPEPPKDKPLTKAQQNARQDFLDQAERYFRLVTEATHARVSNYTMSNYQWWMNNAKLAAGQAASRFVQFVSQGI